MAAGSVARGERSCLMAFRLPLHPLTQYFNQRARELAISVDFRHTRRVWVALNTIYCRRRNGSVQKGASAMAEKDWYDELTKKYEFTVVHPPPPRTSRDCRGAIPHG